MATQTTRRQETWSKRGTSASIPLDPINENRAPTTADAGEPGQQWLDHTANTAYTCFGPDTTGAYIWITSPTGGIAAASMSINPGNLDVTAGDITGGGACTITGLTTTGNPIFLA